MKLNRVIFCFYFCFCFHSECPFLAEESLVTKGISLSTQQCSAGNGGLACASGHPGTERVHIHATLPSLVQIIIMYVVYQAKSPQPTVH